MTTISRYFDQLTVSNARMSCYRYVDQSKVTEEAKAKRAANLSRGQYNGYISGKTKIFIRSLIHNWIGSTTAYFQGREKYQGKAGIQWTFVTLTLPCDQNHDDREIKLRALKPFLAQIKLRFRVLNFFWVGETQKNGNIHFHLIIDRSVHHRKLRDLWNSYMADMGYIQDYGDAQRHFHREGFRFRPALEMKWSYGAQFEAYQRGIACNWTDPNSTDIHKIEHVRNLSAYVTKYVTKKTDGRPIEGRLWGCSDTLRKIRPIRINLRAKLKQVLMGLADETGSNLHTTDFNWTLWRFSPEVLKHSYPTLYEIWSNFNRHAVGQLYPEVVNSRFFQTLVPSQRQAVMVMA